MGTTATETTSCSTKRLLGAVGRPPTGPPQARPPPAVVSSTPPPTWVRPPAPRWAAGRAPPARSCRGPGWGVPPYAPMPGHYRPGLCQHLTLRFTGPREPDGERLPHPNRAPWGQVQAVVRWGGTPARRPPQAPPASAPARARLPRNHGPWGTRVRPDRRDPWCWATDFHPPDPRAGALRRDDRLPGATDWACQHAFVKPGSCVRVVPAS